MWPFRRRRGSADAPAGTTPPAPLPAAGWSSLPPVQRAVPPTELTVGTTAFEAELASRRPPHPFLAALGHDVSAAAPSGIVTGLAAPAVQRSAAPDPELPLLSRRTGGTPARPANTLRFADLVETPSGEGTEPAAAPASEPPLRDLPTVERLEEGPALTTAPLPDLPLVPLPVARVAVAQPAETSQTPRRGVESDPEGRPVPGDAPGETAPLLSASGVNESSFAPQVAEESGAVQATAPAPAVQRSSSADPATRSGTAQDAPVLPLPRLGFGPPLRPGEPHPSLQRSSDAAPAPFLAGQATTTPPVSAPEVTPATTASAGEPAAPDKPASEAPSPLVGERTLIAGGRTAEDAATPPASPPPALETPVPPAQRLATSRPIPDLSPVDPPSNEPVAVVPTGASHPGSQEASTSSTSQGEPAVAPPAEEPPAPLVGEHHLVDVPAAAEPLPAETPRAAPALPLQRAASLDTSTAPLRPRGEAAVVPSASPFTSAAMTGGAVAVQRLPVLSARAHPAAPAGTTAPAGGLPVAQLPAEVAGLPLQRASQSSDFRAVRSLPVGAPLPAQTVSRVASGGPESTMPALPLASAVPKVSAATAMAASGGFETWSFEPPAPSAGTAPVPATVQRAAEDEPAALPPMAGPPAAGGAAPASSPGAGGSGSGAATPEQLDELARRLYDKIRYRLKAELRLDRERAGLLADLRR